MEQFSLRPEPLNLRAEFGSNFSRVYGDTVLRALSGASANTDALWIQWGELEVPIHTHQLSEMDEFLSWISEIHEQPGGMVHANCSDQGGSFTWLATWRGDELQLEEVNGDKPVLKLSRQGFLAAWKGMLAQWLADFERIKATAGLEQSPAVEDAEWILELYQRLPDNQ